MGTTWVLSAPDGPHVGYRGVMGASQRASNVENILYNVIIMITVICYCPRPFRVLFLLEKCVSVGLKLTIMSDCGDNIHPRNVQFNCSFVEKVGYIICFLQKHQLIEVISIPSALKQLIEVISISSIPKSILQTTDDQTAWHFPWIKNGNIFKISLSALTLNSQTILKPAFIGFSAMSLFSV